MHAQIPDIHLREHTDAWPNLFHMRQRIYSQMRVSRPIFHRCSIENIALVRHSLRVWGESSLRRASNTGLQSLLILLTCRFTCEILFNAHKVRSVRIFDGLFSIPYIVWVVQYSRRVLDKFGSRILPFPTQFGFPVHSTKSKEPTYDTVSRRATAN